MFKGVNYVSQNKKLNSQLADNVLMVLYTDTIF